MIKDINFKAVILTAIVFFIIGFGSGFVSYKNKYPCADTIGTTTTVTRDTIRPEVPRPVKTKEVTRLKIKPSKPRTFNGGVTTHEDIERANAQAQNESAGVTIDEEGEVEIPITQKEYCTDDYTAWVSGFKPALDSITLYPKVITNTVTKYKAPRWSITIGPGAYYDGSKVVPTYLGFTAGFVLLSK